MTKNNILQIQLPDKLKFLLSEKHRYKVAYGGRASGKSYSMILASLARAMEKKVRILCVRQFQNSIADSVHKLIADTIYRLKLDKFFTVTQSSIRCINGSEFIFKGIHNNVQEIKSLEGIDICVCFVSGTKVGDKNIEDIKVGEYVDSFNHSTKKIEKRKVLHVFKRKSPKKLYKILTSYAYHPIICTGNHPIFVKGKGYIPAKDIKKGDIVYAKEDRFTKGSSLWERMWENCKIEYKGEEKSLSINWENLLPRLCKNKNFGTDEKFKSNGKRRIQKKDDKNIAGYKSSSKGTWWEWSWLYRSTKNIVEKTWSWMVGRIYSANWRWQKGMPTDSLQGGFSKCLLWNCNRNRWAQSLWRYCKIRGPKENGLLTEQRVESIEIQEQRDIKQLGLSDGGNYVYNIEVQGNNNYFANGLLVHNCEESQNIPDDSWEVLIPTIRKEGSEIWICFNPQMEDDATYRRFVKNPPPDCKSVLINYTDNPWCPEVMKKEAENCKAVDRAKYEHIWLGHTVLETDAQIFKGKFELLDFEAEEFTEFYYGADWGFANDPTALVRCFIEDNCLYVDYESFGVGVEIDELPQLFKKVPESNKWKIRADCARPETISYMARHGYNCVAAEKWQGSVEDGIEFLRSFDKIYIHPRCKHLYEEFKYYSYKKDRVSGDILPIVVDAWNHGIDAIRYALQPYIKNRGRMHLNPDWEMRVDAMEDRNYWD